MSHRTIPVPDDLADLWRDLNVPMVYGVPRSQWLLDCLVAALKQIKQLQKELAELKKGIRA
jgi:hypothetical protein